MPADCVVLEYVHYQNLQKQEIGQGTLPTSSCCSQIARSPTYDRPFLATDTDKVIPVSYVHI